MFSLRGQRISCLPNAPVNSPPVSWAEGRLDRYAAEAEPAPEN